jgi:hypothetical protein
MRTLFPIWGSGMRETSHVLAPAAPVAPFRRPGLGFVLDNRKILFIRPKMFLAMDGNYREGRWFARWMKVGHIEHTKLPRNLSKAVGQDTVPFGDG